MADLIDDIILYIANILQNQPDTLWSFGSTSKYIRRLFVNNKIWHDLQYNNIFLSIIKNDHNLLWNYLIDTQTHDNVRRMFSIVLNYRATNIFSYYQINPDIKLHDKLDISITNISRYIYRLEKRSINPLNASFHGPYSGHDQGIVLNVINNSLTLNVDYLILCAVYTQNFDDIVANLNCLIKSITSLLIDYDIITTSSVIDLAIMTKVLAMTRYHSAKNLTRHLLIKYHKEILYNFLIDVLENASTDEIANIVFKELQSRNLKFSIDPFTTGGFNLRGLRFCLAQNILRVTPSMIDWAGELQIKLELLRHVTLDSKIRLIKFINIAKNYIDNKTSVKDIVILCEFMKLLKINTNCIQLRKHVVKRFNGVNIFELLRELNNANLTFLDIHIKPNFVVDVITNLYKNNKLNYNIISKNKWLVTKMCNPQTNCIWDIWWKILDEHNLRN